MNQKENENSKKGVSQNLILIIVGGLILILTVALIFFLSDGKENNNDNGHGALNEESNNVEIEKPNENPGVIEDQEQDGLKFTNTALITSKYNSTLTTLVTNTTDSDIEVRIFDIFVKDADGNIIATLQGYVGGVVPANGSREIESSVDMDLSAAVDIEYKLVK